MVKITPEEVIRRRQLEQQTTDELNGLDKKRAGNNRPKYGNTPKTDYATFLTTSRPCLSTQIKTMRVQPHGVAPNP